MTLSIAKSILTVFLLSLFMLLLGAACGAKQEANTGGGEQEANAAGGNEDEESPGVEGVVLNEFGDFDANNNELTEQEFNEGLFGSFDADNSGTIAEDEFNTTTDDFFGEFNGSFDDFDANNNNELNQQEFNDAVADAGLRFGELDADNNNVLDGREFQEGMEKPKGT